MKHYLQVNDEKFEPSLALDPLSVRFGKATQNPTQSKVRTEPQEVARWWR